MRALVAPALQVRSRTTRERSGNNPDRQFSKKLVGRALHEVAGGPAFSPRAKPDSPNSANSTLRMASGSSCPTPQPQYVTRAYKTPAEVFSVLASLAVKKSHTHWSRLLVLGFLSGLYVAIGATVALVVGGGIQPYSYVVTPEGDHVPYEVQTKIPVLSKVMVAACFPIALILIILVGGELFTGNVMVMILGLLTKKSNLWDLVKSWTCAIVSNWAGCAVGALAIWGMGILGKDPYHEFLVDVTNGKVLEGFGVNLLKAIPCNMLVCFGVVMSASAEDVGSKIWAMWWPIFTFAVSGFEHSIANMFFCTVASFYGGASWGYGTFVWQNLIPVLIGNTIGGGLFVAVLNWYCQIYTSQSPIVELLSVKVGKEEPPQDQKEHAGAKEASSESEVEKLEAPHGRV